MTAIRTDDYQMFRRMACMLQIQFGLVSEVSELEGLLRKLLDENYEQKMLLSAYQAHDREGFQCNG